MLGTAMLASALLLSQHWDRGWIPHDEGTLAHSAERVLQGEMPHRDFDDPYSGGLSLLNSIAFRLFGVNLAAMRLALVATALACVPAVFYLASRFAGYAAAAAVSFAAIVWSVPNYPAALPSWYNLFFALFGTAAVARHIETGARRWLLLAGVLAGLSIAFKTSGLYFVAAVLLALHFREQDVARAADDRRGVAGIAYSLIVVLALAGFVTALFLLLRPDATSAHVFQFVVPGAALAAVLAFREIGCTAAPGARVKTLLGYLMPFLGGIGIVIVPWLLVYAASGALDGLLNGLFVLPLLRRAFASVAPLPAARAVALLPLVLLFWLAPRARRRHVAIDGAALAAVGIWVLWMAGAGLRTYRFFWYSVLALIPVLVVAGALLVVRDAIGERPAPATADVSHPATRRQMLILLLAVSAMVSLVQFPFTAPVYFCYVAPLALLAALAVTSGIPRMPAIVPLAVLGVYTGFGMLYVNRDLIYTTRLTRTWNARLEPLSSDRGGILVPPADNAEYARLVSVVRAHAASGYTYAAPDSPEVYFLTGLRNPTRTLFDFFETRDGRVARTLAALDRHGVSVIAINRRPAFSGPLQGDLTWRLRERYPHSTTVGRFEVRWR